ncbi:Eukaryotic translation initiation factor 3 subunit K [Melia azedarach]|uniref:Eukaryotic translation initiation factor 3 subunit K n=1 Tax=Melia azedarach TaxID=155640 RepID=A0ACC1XBN5_MELAZ|nr:Eukaryotic translation initiation factor 3 subunit K [Melia azedarach]
MDANLCLLRLYQAVMAMPAPDFSLCLFLIPERMQMEEQFKMLIVLSHYLETGRFCHFWDEAEAAKHCHIVEAVPGGSSFPCSYGLRSALETSRYFACCNFSFPFVFLRGIWMCYI